MTSLKIALLTGAMLLPTLVLAQEPQQQTPGTRLPLIIVVPQTNSPSRSPAAATQTPARSVTAPRASAKKERPKPRTASRPRPPTAGQSAAAPASAPENALGGYNPALDLGQIALPTGTTQTTAGPVQGYRALSAMSATKTATPIEKIPQSVQVLTRSLLDDQRPTSIGDVLNNVSNVQGPSEIGLGNTQYGISPFQIRGFAADQLVDGMPVQYGSGNRDALSNIERIEVLKGPDALLYGGNSGAAIGGVVNMVSKLPTNKQSAEFGVRAGGYSGISSFFDTNQPLTANGTVLFRVTGEYAGAKSFVDILDSKRYAINPTLTVTNNDTTTLTVQGSFSRFEQKAYPGLPAVGTITGGFGLNPSLFPSDPNIIPSFSQRNAVTVTLDHRFDPAWSFNVRARYAKNINTQDSQGPTTAAPDMGPTTWSMLNINMRQDQEEFSINPNLRAKFATGNAVNTVLFGADFSRTTDAGFMYSDFNVAPVDLTNPVFATPYTKPDPVSPTFFPWYDFSGSYKTAGVYAQVQSSLWDRVHLLAGARLANLNVEYFEKVPFGMGGLAPPQTFNVNKTKVLPRVGFVVDLIPGLSAFASYSEGMRWTAFTQAVNLAPEESQQLEGGFKIKLGDQLSSTLSVFDITRSNVPVTIGAGVTDTAAQHGRGFETDLVWQPNRQWSVLAAYGYTDAYYADSKLGTPQGNKLPQVPAHSGRLWVNYAFDGTLDGLTAGAGIYASSGQYVDSANLYMTQGFFTVDSKIAYKTGNWTFAVQAKNLTDEKYFVPFTWFGGQVVPGTPRQIFGSISYKY